MARRPLGVAVVGFGWMGRVHTQAYARWSCAPSW
jgi:hypothetical protein